MVVMPRRLSRGLHEARDSLLPRCSVPGLRSAGSPSTTTAATSSTRRRVITATSSGVPAAGDALCQHLVIDPVLGGGLGTVHVEPPVAYEVLLVKDRPVRTEEAVGDQAALSVPQGAEMEHLALGVRVCILATLSLRRKTKYFINPRILLYLSIT